MLKDEKRFSVYEARTKFSKILQWVMRSNSAVITYHGEPVVRLIPYKDEGEGDLKSRVAKLKTKGLINPPAQSLPDLEDISTIHRKGAVQRFLEERE